MEDTSQIKLFNPPKNNSQLDPQKNIISKSDNYIAEIISTEANYDRWSNFLFPHSKSKNIYGRRKKKREVKLPDGKVSEAIIEITPSQDEKSYTTKTYDVFLALMSLWKEKHMPNDPMELFVSDIARKLDLKTS